MEIDMGKVIGFLFLAAVGALILWGMFAGPTVTVSPTQQYAPKCEYNSCEMPARTIVRKDGSQMAVCYTHAELLRQAGWR